MEKGTEGEVGSQWRKVKQRGRNKSGGKRKGVGGNRGGKDRVREVRRKKQRGRQGV